MSLFGYHIYLISQNRTTLEAFRPPYFRSGGSDRKGFFLGKSNNFREVLGDRPILWFIPVFSSLGDGLTYPRVNPMDEEEGYSDGYESDLGPPGPNGHFGQLQNQNNFRQQINRRFQSLTTEETDEDLDSEADENVQLLPTKNGGTGNSAKMWQETETAHAETSPDSLADVRFSDYSKFNNGGTHLNQS